MPGLVNVCDDGGVDLWDGICGEVWYVWVPTAPTAPGCEWTLAMNRAHWALEEVCVHWTLDIDRAHWTLDQE